MFDLGWSELLVIGIVALVVIGPKELPTALRTMGQWVNKVRRMASEFQGQFQDAIREAELADMKKQFEDTTKDFGLDKLNPLADVRKEFEGVTSGLPDLTGPSAAAASTGADAPAAALPGPTPAETAPLMAIAAPPSGPTPAEVEPVMPSSPASPVMLDKHAS